MPYHRGRCSRNCRYCCLYLWNCQYYSAFALEIINRDNNDRQKTRKLNFLCSLGHWMIVFLSSLSKIYLRLAHGLVMTSYFVPQDDRIIDIFPYLIMWIVTIVTGLLTDSRKPSSILWTLSAYGLTSFSRLLISTAYATCSSTNMTLNTLRPRQNDRHLADDTFRLIFLN